jgi:hypothetical protein
MTFRLMFNRIKTATANLGLRLFLTVAMRCNASKLIKSIAQNAKPDYFYEFINTYSVVN